MDEFTHFARPANGEPQCWNSLIVRCVFRKPQWCARRSASTTGIRGQRLCGAGELATLTRGSPIETFHALRRDTSGSQSSCEKRRQSRLSPQRGAVSLLLLTLTMALTSGIAALPECLPNCASADLHGANLRWADLRGADFAGADLSWADLSRADLSEAVLTGANLSWADLNGTALCPTDLTDVEGCDLTQRLPNCEEGCHATDGDCATIVGRFMRAFMNGDKSALASRFSFPIWREYPIPPIEQDEFLDRYDEVFDETLTKVILDSNLNDWSPYSWRGIQLGYALRLDYGGLVSGIFYVSEYEAEERDRLLELRKQLRKEERLQLRWSLREYVSPILEWETATYRIRVDFLGDETYRYSAWKVDRSHSDEPDLILNNGEITFQYRHLCGTCGGTGGHL